MNGRRKLTALENSSSLPIKRNIKPTIIRNTLLLYPAPPLQNFPSFVLSTYLSTASIAKLSTLPIANRIPVTWAEIGTRLEELAKILRPIALAVGKEEASSLTRVLRVARAARRLLALLTACYGIWNRNLASDGWGSTASVIDLIDALISVGAVDDVVGAAGGIYGRGGLDNCDRLGGGVGARGCGSLDG